MIHFCKVSLNKNLEQNYKYLHAVGNDSAVVNKVKNQLLAYILVWKL